MSYITLAKMKAGLPAQITDKLLDDTSSGAPDAAAWTELAARVDGEIDGKLAQRYSVPLAAPIPAIIENAAFVLAAELLYQRKNFYGEANPWTKRADGIRGTLGQQGGQAGLLDRLADGTEPLFATATPVSRPASAITEPARTTSARGHLIL